MAIVSQINPEASEETVLQQDPQNLRRIRHTCTQCSSNDKKKMDLYRYLIRAIDPTQKPNLKLNRLLLLKIFQFARRNRTKFRNNCGN